MLAAILLLMLTFLGVLQNVSSLTLQATSARSPAIAVVRPVFTAAAYYGYSANLSFYGFYKKYHHVPDNTIIKTDLNLLNTSVDKDSWGHSWGLAEFLHSNAKKNSDLWKNVTILTDIDVNDGKLFGPMSGARMFDVAVLGFSEYVTASEYQNYKRFVETGGGLFFLDATNFLAEVKYNPVANMVSLAKGHGWIFNGTAAWKGPFHRWPADNTNWVGSEYAASLFHKYGYRINGALANTTNPLSILLRTTFGLRVFSSYVAHEENALTNSSDSVIACWDITGAESLNLTVAVYEHEYQKGIIIHTGIFGSDLIPIDPEMQFFLTAALRRLASHVGLYVSEFQNFALLLSFSVLIPLFLRRVVRKNPDS